MATSTADSLSEVSNPVATWNTVNINSVCHFKIYSVILLKVCFLFSCDLMFSCTPRQNKKLQTPRRKRIIFINNSFQARWVSISTNYKRLLKSYSRRRSFQHPQRVSAKQTSRHRAFWHRKIRMALKHPSRLFSQLLGTLRPAFILCNLWERVQSEDPLSFDGKDSPALRRSPRNQARKWDVVNKRDSFHEPTLFY